MNLKTTLALMIGASSMLHSPTKASIVINEAVVDARMVFES